MESQPEQADEFERELLGFCVTSLLDQRSARGENRTYWADRLGLSKSHITKMAELPTVAFIEQFDLALTDSLQNSPVDANPALGHERLNPLLSDFAFELLPRDRRHIPGLVIRWYARYQPKLSRQLSEVLLDSEIALERCRLLESSGGAEYDASVRKSIRNLLLVVSGPYGGSVIAHFQGAELGLQVPATFFDELEATLDSSPLGFRELRTVDRLVRRWRSMGRDPKRQRSQAVDTHLVHLLGRLARASAAGYFTDPYPGAEWTIALARDCIRVDDLANDPERRGLNEESLRWLTTTLHNPEIADRGRLYAAWVIACHADTEKRADAIEALQDQSASAYLRKWAPLVEDGAGIFGASTRPFEAGAHALAAERFQRSVQETFADVWTAVSHAVEAATPDSMYNGLRASLTTIIFSSLVTPDGRIRRALIEGIANASLVTPTATVLQRILGIRAAGDIALEDDALLQDPGVQEAAVFLLGRLRQPTEGPARLTWLLRRAQESDHALQHAAIWSIGDLWRTGMPAVDVVGPLGSIATKDKFPDHTRLAAVHVLAIVAHQEAHDAAERHPREPGPALQTLTEVLTKLKGENTSIACQLRAGCFWAARFDPEADLTADNLLTLSGLLDGNVSEKHDLVL